MPKFNASKTFSNSHFRQTCFFHRRKKQSSHKYPDSSKRYFRGLSDAIPLAYQNDQIKHYL